MSIERPKAPLSALDDLLAHQTPRPFSTVVDEAPNWFDRFYFNLHPPSEGPVLVIGSGRYANVGVADGYACLAFGQEQRNLRFSRRVRPGEMPGEVGPLRFEAVELLRRWRLSIDGEAEGFRADLIWTARTDPYLTEPVTVEHADGEATDFSHFIQPGTWEGTLEIDGAAHDVSGWFGLRDRSWGVRRTRERLGMHLWGGAQLPDRCVFFLYNEGRDGEPVHVDGAVLRADTDTERIVSIAHDLRLDPQGELTEGLILARLESGEEVPIEWSSLGRGVFMAPAGYDGWHGQDRGDRHLEHDRSPLDGSVSVNDMPIALVDKGCSCRVGDDTGSGVFELAISRSSSYTYQPTAKS